MDNKSKNWPIIQKADEMAQKSFFSWVSDLPEISRLAEPVITKLSYSLF